MNGEWGVGGFVKRVLSRVFLTLLLACLLVLATLPYWVSAVGIPTELRVFPGMELSLDLKPPLRILDQDGVEVTGLFDTQDLGSRVYRVSLFGWLPISKLVVDVVPLVEVFPGGQSIGVLLNADGLVISELGSVIDLEGRERAPAKEAGVRPGDILLSIEGHPTRRPELVGQLINSLAEEKRLLTLEVKRGENILSIPVEPAKTRQTNLFGQSSYQYLLGILLEDPAAGVGTLSFFHSETGRFGALGHTVTDSLGRPVEINQGMIVEASIDSVRYGIRGNPGEKVGFFHGEQDILGIIDSNSTLGIYGQLVGSLARSSFSRPIPVAFAHQVRVGPAEMYTVVQGTKIERFSVEIIKVTNQTKPGEKGMVVEVTDERLLRETGGIIQGMSGSPLVQNGMLVGVITHVFVNNPARGYASFAEWMIYEAGLGINHLNPAKQASSREVFLYV